MGARLSDEQADALVQWLGMSLAFGLDRIETLVDAIDRGAADLAIDPFAWENTMAALEWTVIQGMTNEHVVGVPATDEDLQLVRRIHALGSAALAGEVISPELLPLARECLRMLQGPQRPPT